MSADIFLNDKYLKAVFKMFDKDNSGKIDTDEIRKLL